MFSIKPLPGAFVLQFEEGEVEIEYVEEAYKFIHSKLGDYAPVFRLPKSIDLSWYNKEQLKDLIFMIKHYLNELEEGGE